MHFISVNCRSKKQVPGHIVHLITHLKVASVRSNQTNKTFCPQKEEIACQYLFNDLVQLINEDLIQNSPIKMSDGIKRMHNNSEDRSTHINRYHDCSFLFCSIAGDERLWSKASYLLSQQRQMTPLLFEAIAYLKENR